MTRLGLRWVSYWSHFLFDSVGVTPIPSHDPISKTAASSSSSYYLFFLFFISFFVCWVFPSWFVFAFGSSPDGPTAPISLCPAEGIVSPPLRAGFRGKVRGPPKDDRERRTRMRAGDRPRGVASTQPRIVRRVFRVSSSPSRDFFFFFFLSSSFTSVTNIYSAFCLNESSRDRMVLYEIVRFSLWFLCALICASLTSILPKRCAKYIYFSSNIAKTLKLLTF